MEHILFETKIEIPSNLLDKDPRENEEFQDWIMSMLKKNLPCKVFLGLELMWLKISDHLITQQLNTRNSLWIRVGFLQTNLQKNKIWLYYTNI